MNRPRLRNVPRGSLLSTEVTWEIQIRGQNCFLQTCHRKNNRTECFFHFSLFFRRVQAAIRAYSVRKLPRLMGKLLHVQWKIVTRLTGKICYNVTNFSRRRVTIFRQTCNNFPSDVVFKNYKYFLDFTPQKFFFIDFSLNHGILSILCATKKKK